MKRRYFMGLLTAAVARLEAQEQQQVNQQQPVPSTTNAASNGFVISGVVVNSLTNAPVGKALVQISLTADRTQNRSVVTGPDGRFSFANLPANKFALTVTRSNGMPQAFLERGNFSSAIVTGQDQTTTSLVFRFHMPGILAGIILDETNEPVRNATVHLFAHQIDQAGIRRIVNANTTSTKASGQFRFANLLPGTYFVGVSGRPWFAQNVQGRFEYAQSDSGDFRLHNGRPNNRPAPKSDPQFDVVYPFTYYPNAVEPPSASPITITEGNETTIQMNLRAVPSIHVRLVGGDPKPGMGTNIQVSILGPDNLPIALNVGAFTQGGQGELTGVAPGKYQLGVNTFTTPAAQGPSVDIEEGMMRRNNGFARRIVDLVDGATVDLGAVSHVAVNAIVKTATSDRPGNRIAVMLRDRRTGAVANVVAGTDDAVRFPEASLSAGRYEVSLPNTPMFRIVSLEAKGAKVLGNELLIEDNADVQLSVLIGRRSTVNVVGFAMKDDAPLVGAMVLLVPKTASIGSRTYRDQSDSDGSFALQGVSGGSYLALAIENAFDLAFGEPAALKPYLAGAQTITINESNAPPPLKLKVQQPATG